MASSSPLDNPKTTSASHVEAAESATANIPPTAGVATPDIATAVERCFPPIPAASAGAESTIAFAFDVDGVLVRGTEPIPGARETIQLLQDNGIPFILLTNGGGKTEAKHAAVLADRLGVAIDPEQFVQSHSPYHDLVPLYRDKAVLVLGGVGDDIRNLAETYGFRNVVTTSDLHVKWKHLHPFPEMTEAHHSAHGRLTTGGSPQGEISAILVWSSPRDWVLDMQVLLDLLLSSGGIFGRKSLKAGDITLPNNGYLQDGQPKLYFSNPDFEWATRHDQPRFAQGAFREAFRGVWHYATKGEAELQYTVIGKPTETTYVYGEKTLQAYNEKLARQRGGRGAGAGAGAATAAAATPAIKTVYMVGDNPESDIAGANRYESRIPGAEWRSILVETGVHRAGSKPVVAPHHTAANVAEAVMLALQQEKVEVVGADRLMADLESPAAEDEHDALRGGPLDPDALPDTFGALKLDLHPK